MNRSERRRLARQQAKMHVPNVSAGTEDVQWEVLFDAQPMAKGMPPHFLMFLLNEQDVFARFGKLLTAHIWLQSQMAALICLESDPELKNRCLADNTKHLPEELHRAATVKLETLSSESLRTAFLDHFATQMTEDLQADLEMIILGRDHLSHGYIALFRSILNDPNIPWSPRSTTGRSERLDGLFGPRPAGTALFAPMTRDYYEREIARICRMMDFIASVVNQWGIPYPIFA